MRRHDLENVDPLSPEVLCQHRRVLGPVLRDDVEAAAGGQRREDHRVAEVGRDARQRRVVHPGLETQPIRDSQHVAHDVAMLDAGPLGAAGGAARVHHVGEVFGPARRPGRTRPGRGAPVDGIETKRRRSAHREVGHEASLRQHAGDVRVPEHEGDPRPGIPRIQGHVGGPGLQDAQNADHHLQRSLDVEPDERLGPGPHLPQCVRDALGAIVELPIAHPLPFEHHGRLAGSPPGLRFDQVMQAGLFQSDHAIISFMTSLAPAKMRSTRASAHMRAMGYSAT